VKYKRILTLPDWTEKELEELGPCLRQTVESTATLKRLTKERLAW
jgi:hypothetical protein